MPVALPEITIVGQPASGPITIADWFAEGFAKGWREPNAQREPPAPLGEEALSAYYAGLSSGSNARRGIETSYESNRASGVEPNIGGQLFEEVQTKYREAWEEFLAHEDPHDEEELPEIVLAPGTIVLP